MYRVALFGAGKVGEAIAYLLSHSGRYHIKICDNNLERCREISASLKNTEAHPLDLENEKAVISLLSDREALLVALPFYLNTKAAQLALKAGVHYLDLTEDINSTAEVVELSKEADKSVFIPQCGLAPGFISIASSYLIKAFSDVDTIKMRVGALPIYPSNRLKYNLSWSTEGLINEYCSPCEVISDWKRLTVPALEGHETFFLDGDEYEAFNTSGGLGTLCMSLEGKVRKLDYKSVRYKGHRDLMAFLLHDLRFRDDRKSLVTFMERSISTTSQDKCLIFVEVTGKIGKKLVQRTYASTVYNSYIGGKHFAAIQVTTAAGICGPLDLLLSGKLEIKKGLYKTEDIELNHFLDNEFGRVYKDEKALHGIEA